MKREETFWSVVKIMSWIVCMAVAGGAEDFSGFSHHAACTLKTVGMGLSAPVVGFPVPVRIFNGDVFSQAASDGADVRFSKADKSTPLTYQIEEWDPVAFRAAIWVKLDTVYPENDEQIFFMYWGKDNAVSASSGAAVFDTADGCVGVWHLSETNGIFYNSAAYDLPALIVGSPANHVPIPGVIGLADSLCGASFIRVRDKEALHFTAELTLSAWVYGGGSGQGQIITKNAWVTKGTSSWQLAFSNTGDAIFFGTTSGIDTNTTSDLQFSHPFDTTGWHYIVGVKTPTEKKIYVDGVEIASKSHMTPLAECSTDVLIGAQYEWRGYAVNHLNRPVDEARIERVGRSPDWIKLCYETQRPGQTALATGQLAVNVQQKLSPTRHTIRIPVQLTGRVLEVYVPFCDAYELQVLDMKARVLLRESGVQGGVCRIETAILPPGIHTVTITTSEGSCFAKIALGK